MDGSRADPAEALLAFAAEGKVRLHDALAQLAKIDPVLRCPRDGRGGGQMLPDPRG